MSTTTEVSYPILVAGRHGKFGFRKTASELVERTESLRRLNNVDWFQLIDRDFNLYRMKNLKAVAGARRWGGYFFEGPFLSRKVIYQADLQPLKKLRLDEVAELLLGFMRSAQGFHKRDEVMFREKLAESSGNLKNLDEVKAFYEGLKWGDQADDGEGD